MFQKISEIITQFRICFLTFSILLFSVFCSANNKNFKTEIKDSIFKINISLIEKIEHIDIKNDSINNINDSVNKSCIYGKFYVHDKNVIFSKNISNENIVLINTDIDYKFLSKFKNIKKLSNKNKVIIKYVKKDFHLISKSPFSSNYIYSNKCNTLFSLPTYNNDNFYKNLINSFVFHKIDIKLLKQKKFFSYYYSTKTIIKYYKYSNRPPPHIA